MKIVYVCSGKINGVPGYVVNNQIISLQKEGVDVVLFTVKGGGLGYLKSFIPLYKVIQKAQPDIIHAHYSFSGFLAGICSRKPVVVSLMGSEMQSSYPVRLLIRIFSKYFWSKLVVKSEEMRNFFSYANPVVIPNGVDLSRFKQLDRLECKELVGFEEGMKYVVFMADPSRPEKNFLLAQQTVELLGNRIQLLPIYNIPNDRVPLYLNAADAILLTSKWEGSPNVIKEAMACNCPIVSVDVGDVDYLIKDLDNCAVCNGEPKILAEMLVRVLSSSKRTNGRMRIEQLGLDSNSIAKRIIEEYNLLKKHPIRK